MIAALLSTFFLFTLFLLLLQLNSNKKGYFENSNTQKQLKPLPSLSLLWVASWLLTIGKGRLSDTLNYIGRCYSIFQMRVLTINTIFINDYRLGKEMFNKSVFCGKPTNEFLSMYSEGRHGIFFTHGEQWKENRRFTHQHLKDFGFNTNLMESHTHNEIDDMLQNWCSKNGEPFSPHKFFYLPILNTIWVILAGERASADNQELFTLVTNVYESFSKAMAFPEVLLIGLPLKLTTLNQIIKWVPIFPGIQDVLKRIKELAFYIKQFIKAKESTFIVDETPKNLIDAYLKEINKTTDPNSEFYQRTGELNLLAVSVDYFMAGGDTTASTLGWSMLHLIRNPDVQEKIQMEVETVVGVNCRPLLRHRPNCPYTQAFIWEVLRFSPFTAAGLPHLAMDDTSIGPYFIRKGTFLFLNIHGIHHDPKVWGDPENFRPERFLSSDGKTFVRHEAICAFSLGQRRCPGEQLALDNMFLFVSAICQRFFLKPDPLLKGTPELKEVKSLFHVPEAFNMVAVDRLQGCGTVSQVN